LIAHASQYQCALAFYKDGRISSRSALPAIRQVSFVATLPSISTVSFGMPDAHSGYDFSIRRAGTFDMTDENCLISPRVSDMISIPESQA
jgi:RNA-splicing ligase RtcB